MQFNWLKDEDDDMPKWIADERLYLSEDGRVVTEAAPGRKTLLAPKGAAVPEDVCKQYGLGPYAPKPQEPPAGQDGEGSPEGGEGQPAETGDTHRHAWRKDGACRCGAVKPAEVEA